MSAAAAPVPFLAGVKAVDFTQFEAGPSCTNALAWLGADAVKIENPKMGDPGRRLRPGQPDNDPYYFRVFNANKRSMTVNLKSPAELAVAKDMLRQARGGTFSVTGDAYGPPTRPGSRCPPGRCGSTASRRR